LYECLFNTEDPEIHTEGTKKVYNRSPIFLSVFIIDLLFLITIFTSHQQDVKHRYLFGLLLSLPFLGFTQGEFNNWYFGDHLGIQFHSGTVTPLTNSNTSCWNGSATATVSDSTGNLLFYAGLSDGNGSHYGAVYDRTHQKMTTAQHLYAGGEAGQYFLPLQRLNDDSSYYLFAMDNPYSPPSFITSEGFTYSIVDMRLNGGLGDVDPGNKNVDVPGALRTCCMLAGTRHHNNHDAWVTVRQHFNSYSYLTYLITDAGLQTNPVVSNSLFYLEQPNSNQKFPVMIRFSPDGTKMAAIYKDTMEYCSFNSENGQISPLYKVSLMDPFRPNNPNAEFSINSHYLYLAESVLTGKIYQYDATKTDSAGFVQSKTLIVQYSLSNQDVWLQRGPDNKIYVTEMNKDSLAVINYPNLQGTACDYQKNAVNIVDNNPYLGFPHFIEKYKAYIHANGQCQKDSVHFTSDIWPPPDTILWNFGDPASTFNTSTLANPSHIYSIPGTYTVELYVRHIDNRTDTTWKTITILDSPNPALGSDKAICTGDSVMLDAGYWMNSTYAWDNLSAGLYNISTSQTYWAKIAGNYKVTVTNSNGCNGKDTVQVSFNPPPAVSNNPLNATICSGQSTNIPLTSVPSGANFHWTATLTSGTVTGFSADSGLVINQVLTDLLFTPGIVTYHITPKIGGCAGTTVNFQVTVNPGIPVTVSISESQNNVCAGTMVTFTATPGNQGSSPVYQWKVNGINQPGNSTTFSYTPLNNDVVNCVLTSSNSVCTTNNPATSNAITMTVNPNLVVSVTISPNPSVVCQGQTTTFTATPTHGGTTPAYQWYLNSNPSGTNSATYTFTPVNGDIVSCTLTSSEMCTITNPVPSTQYPVTVTPLTPVSITITSSQNPFCSGGSVTFNANPNGGGLTPSFQWKVNGGNVGGGTSVFTYTPVAGDIVCCILTSSLPCTTGNPATSNCITMIVNTGLPAGVSITAVPNPFCPGASVTCTAAPTNGGPLPTYQWKVNGINTGTGSSYTYNPVNGDSVRCIMTSNLSCVTGSPASSSKIIMSGTLAPTVTFVSCFDTITRINAKPIKLKGGIPLGGTYSGPGVNSLTGMFTPALAGVGTLTITYSYTNAALCTALAHTHIINYPLSIVNCGSPITDIRDNKIYQTVQIGSQCWLASNLNFGTTIASSQDQRDNCVAEKYCYNDNPINCTNHGGLYQWDEVMRFDETPADQGYCPPGWHIPSENDWNNLFAVYINSGFAGSPLKYSGYSGFNALLSGARHISRGWDFNGFATFFWSSTPRSDNKAWAHGMNDIDPSVSLYPASRVNGFSVRCLKD
jgi:uncharacterized protein (TIGR02145 family)